MRRALPVALLALAAFSAVPAPAPARAQAPRLAYGVYVGFKNSTMKGDSVPGPLSKNGFLGGTFLTWPLADGFALQPEIVFAQKGVTTLDAQATGLVSTDIRVSYVEVPVLLRWSGPRMGGGITPYLLAGPEVSVRAGCDVVVGGLAGNFTCADVGSGPKNAVCPACADVGRVRNGVESSDFGAIAGAGIDFRIGARRYTMSVRYDYGMHNVVKNNDAKNRTLGVVAGLVW
jgi:hypothetical protein